MLRPLAPLPPGQLREKLGRRDLDAAVVLSTVRLFRVSPFPRGLCLQSFLKLTANHSPLDPPPQYTRGLCWTVLPVVSGSGCSLLAVRAFLQPSSVRICIYSQVGERKKCFSENLGPKTLPHRYFLFSLNRLLF